VQQYAHGAVPAITAGRQSSTSGPTVPTAAAAAAAAAADDDDDHSNIAELLHTWQRP